MPCFNNSAHLREAINSVLDQDYPNIEVIVVDDGSTDNSSEILQEYGGQIVTISQENSGPAAARNTGMKAARGAYVAFNDSDDIWLPGKLTAQISQLESSPEIGLCYTGWIVWDQARPLDLVLHDHPIVSAQEIAPELSGWIYLALLKDSYIHTTTAVIRKNTIEEVGYFNADYRIGEDHDYWLRISQHCQVLKLKRPYSVYRDNPIGITKTFHQKNYSLLVLEENLERFGLSCRSGDKISQRQANQYLGERNFVYGYQAMLNGSHRALAFRAFVNCIKYRYKLARSLLLMLACSNRVTFNLLHTARTGTPGSS